MDLERIEARIRPRRPWEAVDLGLAMVAAWPGPVFRAWLTVALPVMAAIGALALWHPILAGLILWWLKPLMDRAPLQVVAGRLFGRKEGWRTFVRSLPALMAHAPIRGLIGHRLDPSRSFTMPVDELEKLKGGRRAARLKVFGRRQRTEAFRLTAIWSLAELCCTWAGVLLALFLLPESWLSGPIGEAMRFIPGEGIPDLAPLAKLAVFCQMIAIAILEPYYVAAGFSLYLNRRTELEAWDLELSFRALGARLAGPPARVAAILLLMASLLALPAAPLFAQEEAPEESPVETPAEISEEDEDRVCPECPPPTEVEVCQTTACLAAHQGIAEVMADPAFGGTQKRGRWRLRSAGAGAEPGVPWLSGLGAAIASAVEPILWIGALAAVVGFLTLRHRFTEPDTSLDLSGDGPREILGFDLRRATLPDRIAVEARRLVAAGQIDEALGLLLRGALAQLALKERVPLRPAMTEGECVAAVRRHAGAERAACFRDLAAAWSAAAYGHHRPDAEAVGSLIDRWDTHFGEAP